MRRHGERFRAERSGLVFEVIECSQMHRHEACVLLANNRLGMACAHPVDGNAPVYVGVVWSELLLDIP